MLSNIPLVSARDYVVYLDLLFQYLYYPVTLEVKNKIESQSCTLKIQLRIVSKQRGQLPVIRVVPEQYLYSRMIFYHRPFMSAKRPAKAIIGESDSETGVDDTRK